MEDNIIILAAGRGSRMGAITNKIPKPLSFINGMPAIVLLLEKISKYFPGCPVSVVVGYKKDLIISTIKKYNLEIDIKFIFNENFANDTNIFSTYLGLKDINSNCFIFESDCFFDDSSFERISVQDDKSYFYTIGDFTKNQVGGIVKVIDNKIIDLKIVKNYSKDFDGYKKLIGLTKFSKSDLLTYHKLVKKYLNDSYKFYYHQPVIDSLSQFNFFHNSLEDFYSAAFNTADELRTLNNDI